jgi:aminoglycoside phosphotransferase (APT) family kinase protein
MTGIPPAEVHIDTALVRALLRAQHPDLAELPLAALDAGWDNSMFRLGEELVVRMPRRQIAAELVRHEQTWLPVLAPRLSLAIPTPLRMGVPAADYVDYPWHWSIVPWFEGMPADSLPLDAAEARRLAQFLAELHQPAPPDAPHNPARGVPLAMRANSVEDRLGRLRTATTLITPRIEQTWHAALAAPPSATRAWLHGDLHAHNVLARADRIVAIIDWGDLTAGDVATDLACAWMLFDEPAARNVLLESYAPTAALLARARGWAVLLGAALLDTGLSNSPRHAALGAAILRRLDQTARDSP